jgi:hypothetical protein
LRELGHGGARRQGRDRLPDAVAQVNILMRRGAVLGVRRARRIPDRIVVAVRRRGRHAVGGGVPLVVLAPG